MAFGLTSCGSDDVVDLFDDTLCETQSAGARLNVDAAITAYEAAQSVTTCTNLKNAINLLREFECVADDAFATEFDALPDDCSSIGI